MSTDGKAFKLLATSDDFYEMAVTNTISRHILRLMPSVKLRDRDVMASEVMELLHSVVEAHRRLA